MLITARQTLVKKLLKVGAFSTTPISNNLNNNSNNKSNANNNNATNEELKPDRLLDSRELEIEHGITITSKVMQLNYTLDNTDLSNKSYVINIVDTSSHSDFAGEVDRVLFTVNDGIILVVNANAGESPKSQMRNIFSRARPVTGTRAHHSTQQGRYVGESRMVV